MVGNVCHCVHMTAISEVQTVGAEVHSPKLDGHRVALRGRVYPETHRRAVLAARQHGLSLSDYLASLIDADTNGALRDRTHQEALDIPA